MVHRGYKEPTAQFLAPEDHRGEGESRAPQDHLVLPVYQTAVMNMPS
tara:strand:- start:741 stop:881 length:141 start_codon:yes stop_codon:yes gene_type:complete